MTPEFVRRSTKQMPPAPGSEATLKPEVEGTNV
jgi:hypothetical protein